ncbi:MAG: hypothetical protein P8188_21085 [Gemmatimonadota bacterium]|jgi:hypothetical protein
MSRESSRWSFLIAEAILIVVSILLAFAIDAWWADRQVTIEERELLAGLEAEFEFQRSELDRHMERWASVRDGTERLIQITASGVAPSPVVMDSLLFLFLTPTTFDPRQGSLDALTVSGNLGTIRNRELRTRLAAWRGVVEEVRDNEVAMRGFILSVVTPYLAREGVPLARSRALLTSAGLTADRAPGQWPGELPSDAEAARAYAELVADPEFEVLVGTRYGWINVDEYADAIAFVDELLAMITAESR